MSRRSPRRAYPGAPEVNERRVRRQTLPPHVGTPVARPHGRWRCCDMHAVAWLPAGLEAPAVPPAPDARSIARRRAFSAAVALRRDSGDQLRAPGVNRAALAHQPGERNRAAGVRDGEAHPPPLAPILRDDAAGDHRHRPARHFRHGSRGQRSSQIGKSREIRAEPQPQQHRRGTDGPQPDGEMPGRCVGRDARHPLQHLPARRQ